MQRLIINADDFGMSPEINSGIKQGIKAGVLTSVSVMVNMPYFDDAVRFLKKHPEVKVGLHFNITEGTPLLWPSQVSTLLREDNDFCSLPVATLRFCLGQISLDEAKAELVAQYAKLSATGLKIAHIDSHHHIHLFPPLFYLVCNFALTKKVTWLRCRKFTFSHLSNGLKVFPNLKQIIILTLSFFNNIYCYSARKIFSTDSLYDLNWDKSISESKFLKILHNLPDGITVIICHPAILSKHGNKKFLDSRYHCLKLITRPKITRKIKRVLKTLGTQA
jgi:chitin disaccharide deacetylase